MFLFSKVHDDLQNKSPGGSKIDGKHAKDRVETVTAICERNRARIAHSRLQMSELIDQVENAAKKIRASLIW